MLIRPRNIPHLPARRLHQDCLRDVFVRGKRKESQKNRAPHEMNHAPKTEV